MARSGTSAAVAFTSRSDRGTGESAETGRLITRFQAGDESAFTELYRAYFDRVYGYVRMVVNDRHEAEDLAQEVFARAFQALPDYEPRRPFLAWLFRIARNAAIDLIRRRQRIDVTEPTELDSRRDRAETSDVESVLAWLSDQDLALFVGRLPLAQRQVLTLRYLLDLSTAEIAELVDRSEKAVRQLQSRALATLQARLVAVGRRSAGLDSRVDRAPTLTRLKPMPVMVHRRFAVRRAGRNQFSRS